MLKFYNTLILFKNKQIIDSSQKIQEEFIVELNAVVMESRDTERSRQTKSFRNEMLGIYDNL
jgi:hypothetical protein